MVTLQRVVLRRRSLLAVRTRRVALQLKGYAAMLASERRQVERRRAEMRLQVLQAVALWRVVLQLQVVLRQVEQQ